MDAQFFTSIMSGIITILGAIFLYVLVPWVKQRMSAEQLAQLMLLVNVAVTAVEQLFKGVPEITGPEKKQYALDYLRTLGVDIDTEELDALIEAMVYQMNLLTKDKIPDADQLE